MITLERLIIKIYDRILYHIEDKRILTKITNKWLEKGLYDINLIIKALNTVTKDLEDINFNHRKEDIKEVRILRDLYNEIYEQ